MIKQPKETPVTLGEAEKETNTIKDPYTRLLFDWLIKEVKRLSKRPKDERTIAELAEEALLLQDACNLSGVVHGWGRSIARLRKLLEDDKKFGTDLLNTHPINQLWADKVSSLTGPISVVQSARLSTYCEVEKLARS